VGDRLTVKQAEFVTRRRVAHIASVTMGGEPHVVPVSPVLDGDRVVFASEVDTQKVRNLRGDPHVAICFDEYGEDWTALQQVIVYGRSILIESGPEFDRGRGLLYENYAQYETEAPIEQPGSLIVEVRIDRVTSWGL
jgi:nitroimidazol reductase NimA-like FMN-containing flavoprotein (pyridoxamine 5'-phosphate oxidase superfamily)